jgi:hypothetical protein
MIGIMLTRLLSVAYYFYIMDDEVIELCERCLDRADIVWQSQHGED